MDTAFIIQLWNLHYMVDIFTDLEIGHSKKMADRKYSALYSKYGLIWDTAILSTF